MVSGLKLTVKRRIQEHEERLWKVSTLLYRDLSFYTRCVKFKEICVWWKFVSKSSGSFKGASCVVSLLCGTQPKGYGVNCGRNQRCKLCGTYEIESIQHTVFDCGGLDDIRGPYMQRLCQAMPYAMRESYFTLTNKDKLDFILSGLRCDKYEDKRRDIYVSISKLILELYRHRAFLYKRYEETEL